MKLIIRLMLAFVLLAQCSFAQIDAGQVFTLENGLNVFIRPMRASPVVAVNLWVKAGSVNEQPGEEGYAHLLERLIFKGSGRFPAAALENEIRMTGSRHSSFTANDYTSFSLTGASVYQEKMLEILVDAVFNSALEAGDLVAETRAILEETIVSSGNPNNRVVQLLMEEAFKVHPYRHPIIGYRQIIEQVTREKLVNFYKKFYVPANMWLIVTGDVDSALTIELVKKFAGQVPRAEAPLQKPLQEPPQKGMRVKVETADITNTYIRIGWRVPGVESVDRFPLYLIARMIGGGTSSWLWKELVDDRQIALSAGAGYYSSQYPMLFQVGGVTTPGKAKQFVDAARSIVYRLLDGEISNEEIEKARQQIIADDYFGRETAENQAANFGHFAMLSDIRDSESFADNIRAVNLEDIRRVASEYLNDNNLTIARLEPKAAADDALPEMLTLDNGVKIILKENHSSPVVAVVAKVAAGGMLEDKREGGLANLTAEMLIRGTKKMSGSELASALASMGSKYSSQTSKSFVTFSLQTLSENFNSSLELFLDILENPDFPSSGLDNMKTQIEEQIRLEEEDVYKHTTQQALMAIFPETPISYSNYGRLDDVRRIKRQDLVDFHSENYVGGNIVVAIVGDFYSKETREWLLRNFARFSSKQPRETGNFELKEVKGPIEVAVKKNIEQAQIVYVSRTLPISDERCAALEIAQTILSGGSNSRLIRNLRDRDAVAFSSWAFNTGMANTGYFLATAVTSPARASEASAKLLAEVEAFKNGFSAEEFELARKFLVGQYALSLADNQSLAENFASDELLGRGFDFYRRYPQILASATPELVTQAARQYMLASGSYAVAITAP
ncbi:MAG TPA: pitrilysin family protein [Candidatus Rifleibacterium sp.]|nr:pitrilysin family protein [Candidatus Rifleibacterium sp.]HPT46249.1 pitrilysin family protein [Candidatus Rifleibacterium sp.]